MTRPTAPIHPGRTVVRVGTSENTRLVTVKGRRGYLPGTAERPSGAPDPAYMDRHTGRPAEPGSLHGPHPGWVDHTDSDTDQYGFDGPYEPWEADHRALVGILWGFRHDGLIATDPGLGAPLRHALYQRLHGRSPGRPDTDDLITDLRAILDTFDPEVTPGAIGAAYLPQAEARAAEATERERRIAAGEPLDGQEPADAAATYILHSRWRVAFETHAQARALVEAAREEEAAGFPEVANRLRRRAQDLTGIPAALTSDRPTDVPTDVPGDQAAQSGHV